MKHVIRLREPWEVSSESTADDSSQEPRRIRLRRRFHRPTGLCADDEVWLAVDGLARVAQITLNSVPLALASDATGTLRGEIRSYLTPQNEIVIELLWDGPEPMEAVSADLRSVALATGQIRLEINSF